MLLKAAINGGRSRAEHASVPMSPAEQADAVTQCLQAGAHAVHLHVRSTDQTETGSSESLRAEDVARTMLAVRAVAPEAAIGVSTGAWILPDVAARWRAVAEWTVFPDFASVNFNEAGAVELANLLLSRGVGVEAGLCDAAAAQIFVKSNLAARSLRVLIEPQEQEMSQALATVAAIERVLTTADSHLPPLLLHGAEFTAWPMLDEAFARGYDVRIGLEDTLVLPDGSVAQDNGELIVEAMRRGRTAGRAVSGQR